MYHVKAEQIQSEEQLTQRWAKLLNGHVRSLLISGISMVDMVGPWSHRSRQGDCFLAILVWYDRPVCDIAVSMHQSVPSFVPIKFCSVIQDLVLIIVCTQRCSRGIFSEAKVRQ